MEPNFMNFVSNLKYMGLGLIGIFLIIGIIIGATMLCNYSVSKAAELKAAREAKKTTTENTN